jgi:hypothetical protein
MPGLSASIRPIAGGLPALEGKQAARAIAAMPICQRKSPDGESPNLAASGRDGAMTTPMKNAIISLAAGLRESGKSVVPCAKLPLPALRRGTSDQPYRPVLLLRQGSRPGDRTIEFHRPHGLAGFIPGAMNAEEVMLPLTDHRRP